ncbi:hypothetical protein BJF79_30710 [Actinomadura sp. CNU-125]|uniref:DNA translocase FtsK n=1 Tax=Actinomadura sp. CNU-125 TaxID=1904961 RepID=UPI00095DF68B|nr:DNA translocase FtsK [Actinomadura sp. CNU-125]OLT36745.1 hypothetical protein BJF79_30710 [Actinomadura sp. CNU-125]
MWFVVANITGVTHAVTFAGWFFVGGALALAWNIRAAIRTVPVDEQGRSRDPLKALFDGAKAKARLEGGSVRTKEITDRKARAALEVPEGMTVDEVQKRIPALEAAANVPPGSFTLAHDSDNAGQGHFTVTDPRIMNAPIPWPGPSRPGGSIADPSRVGIFQDSEPAELIVPGSNLQVMGASGSGKSMGGAWNLLAEAITRRDVAVFGVDLAKDDQTLGPLRPALHRLETDKAGAVKFLRELHAAIPERTKWLAKHGFNDWEPGCGLTYWLVLFEEVAKIFDVLGNKDQELVEQVTKEIRSAGGRVIMSLQKSIFSEMPTIIRSQMAFMCFGLNDGDDAQYGLSEAQQRAGAAPELWGAGKPEHVGKAFLDAKGVPETHIAMPLRTFAWGSSAREAAAAMTAYAAQWPAADRAEDNFTRRLAGMPLNAPAKAAAEAAAVPLRPVDEPPPAPAPATIDDVLPDAAELVIAAQYASTEMLQRKLRLSHDDSVRVLEALELKSILGRDSEGRIIVLTSPDDVDDVVDELRDDGDTVAEYVTTPDPDPTVTGGPNDDIPNLPDHDNVLETPLPEGGKLSPEAAQRLVEDWLRHRYETGQTSFGATDAELQQIRARSGMTSRSWVNRVLDRLTDDGALDKTREGAKTVYRIVDLEPLGGVPA